MTRSDPLAAFSEQRGHLFGVAYRMLGSVAEAEDVVQDSYLRWSAADRSDVESPVAFLTTTVTRLAIDRLRSARVRRETYVGPWLPEPLVTQVDGGPEAAVEVADSLTTAFLVLLERLNPVERAVFLLHEVFGYRYDEVAEVVERPAPTCRQIASRARAHLADARPRYVPGPQEEQRLVEAFSSAALGGDVAGLIATLAGDVVLWSDGGADRHAARRPVVGPERVARFVTNLAKRLPADATVAMARLNGDPGVVVTTTEGPFLTLALELGHGVVQAVNVVVNPDKLRHLRPAE